MSAFRARSVVRMSHQICAGPPPLFWAVPSALSRVCRRKDSRISVVLTKSEHVWIRARRRKLLSEVSRTPRSVYAGTIRLKSRVWGERSGCVGGPNDRRNKNMSGVGVTRRPGPPSMRL